MMYTFFRNTGLFVLIVAWIFSGWPQFTIQVANFAVHFPPKTQKAHAITCGTGSNVTFTDIGGGVCRAFITDTALATFTVPNDWVDSNNTVEAIGGGGGGCGHTSGKGFGGGGGGAYAKRTNITLTPASSVDIQVGAGGAFRNVTGGEDTWFNTTSCAGATAVCAAKGSGTISLTGGAGGLGSASIGTITANGGNAADGNDTADSGGGGGGAGGPNGAGAAGGVGDNDGITDGVGGGGGGNGGGSAGGSGVASDTVGADGGNNSGGTGGGAGGNNNVGADGTAGGGGGGGSDTAGSTGRSGGNGGAGNEWSTHGSGGGGGGAGDNFATDARGGGVGGLYGGGAGGNQGTGQGNIGAQGIVVITYTPVAPPTVTTNFANPGATTATLYGTKTGGEDATQHGFAWGTSATMVGDTATTTLGALTSNSSFASGIAGLTASLTYYFRAYATGGTGTGYGIIRSFVTGNTTVSRNMRLFEGFTIKLRDGRIILNQQ